MPLRHKNAPISEATFLDVRNQFLEAAAPLGEEMNRFGPSDSTDFGVPSDVTALKDYGINRQWHDAGSQLLLSLLGAHARALRREQRLLTRVAQWASRPVPAARVRLEREPL